MPDAGGTRERRTRPVAFMAAVIAGGCGWCAVAPWTGDAWRAFPTVVSAMAGMVGVSVLRAAP